jgi:antitoxin MazE
MRLTVSKWGNSLAVRIPAAIARNLSLGEGSVIECETTPAGTVELIPTGRDARAQWVRNHFQRVNERIAGHAKTTPTVELLRNEDRY